MRQVNLKIGIGPDYLMTEGQITIMHSLNVNILAIHAQEERFKFVDRSFQKVWLDFRGLLIAKCITRCQKFSRNKQDLNAFEILADSFQIRATLQFPPKLPDLVQEALGLIFYRNLEKFYNL